MIQDLRLAVRELRRRPVITLVAAISLALGIGANSAIFSYIDGLYLRPLAVPDVGRLVRVFASTEQHPQYPLSYPEFEAISKASSFSGAVAAQNRGARLFRGDQNEMVSIYATSPDFFQVLGVQPQHGRVFSPADTTQPVVVLGSGAWHRFFSGDPHIVGKTIQLSRGARTAVTVIGILPASFKDIFPRGERDIWMPPATFHAITDGEYDSFTDPRNTIYWVLARLKPGATVEHARAELKVIDDRLARQYPDVNARRRLYAVSDLGYRLESAGKTGILLLGVVLLVVSLACVNVANLLLARVEGRRQELAIRAAIGATRWRLMRQLLIESAVLGLVATVLGLAIARWLIDIIPALLAITQPDLIRLDARALTFTFAAALLTVVLFGLAPACIGATSSLTSALKHSTLGTRRWPLRNMLALAQVSVSLVLLAVASLLVLSFRNTQTGDIGLSRKSIVNVWQSQLRVGDEGAILERIRAIPGVRAATVAFRAPLSGSGTGFSMQVRPINEPPVMVRYNTVEQRYFDMLGIRLLRGRTFTDMDNASSAKVAVISESMARRFWPNEDPIGRFIRSATDWQVIGIVSDAPIATIGELPEPYCYTTWSQNPTGENTFLIETDAGIPTIKAALKEIDPRLERAVYTSMSELIRYRTASYSHAAQLVTALGLLGLLLTAVGLYGVIAYGVTLRTREIGIRMALGARDTETARMIMMGAMKLAAIGIAIGLPLSLLAARGVQSSLFGVTAWHWPTFLGMAALLLAVAAATSWLPARRAARVNPIIALRYD